TLHRVYLRWTFRHFAVIGNELRERVAELRNALLVTRQITDERARARVPTNREILLRKIGRQSLVDLHEVCGALHSGLRIARPRLGIIKREVEIMFGEFTVELVVRIDKLHGARRRNVSLLGRRRRRWRLN